MTEQSAIETHSAHWGFDDHRYFGYAAFGELLGNESLTGLGALSILGRRLPADACALLDDAAVSLTLADPRIWPLKLTRLLSSYGCSLTGVAGGLLVQDNARIGPWVFQKAAELLEVFHRELGASGTDSESAEDVVRRYFASHEFMWGFGTPFRQHDERLVAFSARVRLRERDRLPYWSTFQAIAGVVVELRRAQPNIAMGLAAVCLDLGLRPDEIGPLATMLMQHMFFAHGVEGARNAPEIMRCLPDESVIFVERRSRRSPRAVASELRDAPRA
jgi:hypothetical protein